MAPPNRYTNSSISMIGNASEVIRASTLRMDNRTARRTMISRSPAGDAGRRARSDTGRLLLLRGVPGQCQEHVVEGRGVHGEPVDRPPRRVELVQHGTDMSRGAVGGDGQRELARVRQERPLAEPPCGEVERG